MALDSGAMDSQTSIYNFVVARLREKRIPQRRVARESGVAFSTVCKIAQGSIKEPSVHKVQRLYDYFVRVDAASIHQGGACGTAIDHSSAA